MAKMLWIASLSVAVASTADAVKASAAHPLESLAVTASSLGQKALDDPACFALVESLTTEIGQRLAGTEAHKRAVAWAEAKLKAGGFENVHSEPFTLDPRRRERGDRRSGAAASRHCRTRRLGRDGCQRHRGRDRALPDLCRAAGGAAGIACRQDRGGDAAHGADAGRQRLWRGHPDPALRPLGGRKTRRRRLSAALSRHR